MAGIRKNLDRIPWAGRDRRGVTAAEHAILAVGVMVIIGRAIRAFMPGNPMSYAGSARTSGQSSPSAGAL